MKHAQQTELLHVPLQSGNELEMKRTIAFLEHHLAAETFHYTVDGLTIHLYVSYKDVNKTFNPRSFRHESPIDIRFIKDLLKQTYGGYYESDAINSKTIVNIDNHIIQGHGYHPQHEIAEKKAVFEYMERFAAVGNLAATIVDKRAHNREKYLDPTLLGLYDERDSLSLNIDIYSDELPIEWTPAQSLLTKRQTYIPEQYVQYLNEQPLHRFVYDNSNGIAIGNTKEEAIYYASLEVLERHMFIDKWFSDEPFVLLEFPPSYTWYEARRTALQQEGYSLNFFLLTEPNAPVHAIWCLICSEGEDGVLHSTSGFKCGTNLTTTVEGAFEETYKSYLELKQSTQLANNRFNDERLNTLSSMEDHILFFATKRGKAVLQQRLAQRRTLEWQTVAQASDEPHDFPTAFAQLTTFLAANFADVLVVEQSNPLLTHLSLHCYKCILLGEQPLDFGTSYVRNVNLAKYNIIQAANNLHPVG